MKKRDFLNMLMSKLESLSDEDEVFVLADGGEYWGPYESDPEFEIRKLHAAGATWPARIGHPKDSRETSAKTILILK